MAVLVGFDHRKNDLELNFFRLGFFDENGIVLSKIEKHVNFSHNSILTLGENLFDLIISNDKEEKQWAKDFIEKILHENGEGRVRYMTIIINSSIDTPERKELFRKALVDLDKEKKLIENLRSKRVCI